MYKTIIVPIDPEQTEKGKAMIACAKELCDQGGRIVLTMVIEDIPVYVAAELPGGVLEKSKESARKDLEKMATSIDQTTEIEVRAGHAPTAILAVAEERDADLIIVASHKPELQDYLLGSTAGKVVRHAECSVLVMR